MQVLIFILFDLQQTTEVLELSKQIKEKLKEADQYGIVITINTMQTPFFLFLASR